MCWFVQQHFWNIQTCIATMSRRKQANPAKLDPQEDDDICSGQLGNSKEKAEKCFFCYLDGAKRVAEEETGGTSGTSASGETANDTFEDEAENENKSAPPYRCILCGTSYVKEKQLRDHEQSHLDQLQFSCSYCPRLFKHKRSRDRHTKLHTGDKKYKCQQCDSAFSRSDHLKIHMKTHDSRKPYKCGTCNRGYNTAAALSSHQQSHLKREPRSGSRTSGSTPSPSGPFRCSACNETFNRSEQLQSHLTMCRSDTESTQSPTPDDPSDFQIEDLKIVCMYCAKEFPSLDSMYRHSNTAHRDMPNGRTPPSPPGESLPNGTTLFSCDQCTMQFESIQAVNLHINLVHWRPHDDPTPTSSSKEFEVSVTEKNPNTPTQSPISPLQTQPTDLSRNRVRKHSETTNLSDTSKSKKNKKQDLTCNEDNETLSHPPSTLPPPSTTITPGYSTNDKPCICSYCHAQLPNFKSFFNHMESHIGASNAASFVGFCPVCGEPGRDSVSFASHIFSHAIVQVSGRCCHHCKRTFERYEDLQKHLQSAHIIPVFKCSICSEIFETKISMQIHLTSKHCDECKHFKCNLCTDQVFHDQLSAELHISMKHYVSPHGYGTNLAALRGGYQVDVARLREYETLFTCHFCQVPFKDQYSLYVHMIKEHSHHHHHHNYDHRSAVKMSEKFFLDAAYSNFRQNQPSNSPNYLLSQSTPDVGMQNESCISETVIGLSLHTESGVGVIGNSQDPHHQTHKKVHKTKVGPVSLQCAYCSEYCKSRNDLEHHMKSQHHQSSGSAKGKHKCNICDEIFTAAATLADHKLTHCKIIDGNCCVQCKALLKDEQSFYHHQYQHSTTNNHNSNTAAKMMTQINLPANCVICCQTLQTDVEVKLHAKFHLKHLQKKDHVPILCGVCLKPGERSQFRSVEKCGTPIIVCKDCYEKDSISEYRSVAKSFACIQCEQTFENEADVQSHATSFHSSVTAFECRLCKQNFESPLKLQVHLIEHSFVGLAQYNCYVCSSVFTTAGGLQGHIVGHGFEAKLYECSQCELKFFFRAELDNHMLCEDCPRKGTKRAATYEVSNEFRVCQYCGSSFLERSFYLEHLNQCAFAHNKDKPLECDDIKQEITSSSKEKGE